MFNKLGEIANEDDRQFSELVHGEDAGEDSQLERMDGSFKGNRLVVEEDEHGNPKVDENGDVIHYWYNDGILVSKEDLIENFELIDEMPIGMRNVMLSGDEIAKYMEWKRAKLEKENSRQKTQGIMALRSMVGKATGNKKGPTLGEWLGHEEGTPNPNHTETDDELDWGDVG